ncbi:helix-turn-helix domain-containing protein [Amycolatopsis sp. H20-H5]|uniref:helix-turn-helix domain-containing protein n=1 Tax=Amycolatopsis sp. H20-H5 TaxID=3046309 RepID=UPI002DBC9029|nr:helix-turn-helix domain-containing protein [Amycolatopsis sp. H20-H5]MEC3975964.1 helix-turn-helix domain-containing protein [Amycolatopsis sp. H20-H5]
MDDVERVLDEVGPRLKRLRRERGTTLAALAERTGISVSTLSRLESGGRKATLELLLTLAKAYQVPLDDLVGAPAVEDPRVRLEPRKMGELTVWPLTGQPGQPQAFKLLVPPTRTEPELRVHEGYEWLYVLSGRLRLLLGDRDMTLGPGEAAEFDTRVPHWFGSAGNRPVELLSLFGKQGERAHFKARAAKS